MNNSNVLRPELVWIEGRCYRKMPVIYRHTQPGAEPDEDDISDPAEASVGAAAQSCPVEDLPEDHLVFDVADAKRPERGGFKLELDIAAEYFKFVIGRQGDNKRRLEYQTQTEIQIPRLNQTGRIVIYGDDKSRITACRRRILDVIDSARQRQEPTHFLSIPFNSGQIRAGFEEFKDQVLKQCGHCRGVSDKIFNKAEKLHLTIGMMVLMSDAERDEAKKSLELCDREVVQPLLSQWAVKGKQFALRGLNYMNDDPSAVRVLYGTVEDLAGGPAAELQSLVDSVLAFFSARNAIVRQQSDSERVKVKMHVTLMNAKFAVEDDSARIATVPETFDCTQILQKFGGFDFGVQEISELHLSQRFSISQDGYYMCSYKIRL